jgi:hypothetical protein
MQNMERPVPENLCWCWKSLISLILDDDDEDDNEDYSSRGTSMQTYIIKVI